MRPIQALLKGTISFGGGDGTFDQGPFWSRPQIEFRPLNGNEEKVEGNFAGMVKHALKANGAVSAVMLARQLTFSEIEFRYQRTTGDNEGELWRDESLHLLENPWPNGTTGELLSRMDQDVSLAGNFYAALAGNGTRIRRLRPDWVTVMTGSPSDDPFDIEAEVIGYMYQPRGDGKHRDPVLLSPDRVVHYSPIPDPVAQWRGMSWLTPVINEIQGHSAATQHKLAFFRNGTTSNFVVSYPQAVTKDQFIELVNAYREAHEGTGKAYKTIHLGGGADITAVGADLKQLDFKATQGASETLIAANSGVGAIIAQLSEGLSGSSLNMGNFNAARRRYADMTMRPLWRMASGALSKFSQPGTGSRLWYDAEGVAFLQEDAKDAAEIGSIKATAMSVLVNAGFEPTSVVAAVEAQNNSLLRHTNKLSVQLQDVDSEGKGLPAGDLAALVQKVYLGVVNRVITAEEARSFLADSGFPLSGPPPSPPDSEEAA